LFRQIGGSVGVAMVGTLMASRGHQNYLDLASKVSLLNPATQSAYYGTVSNFISKSVGFADAHHATLRALKGRVLGQVFMLNFNQLIWIIAIVFAMAYIPLYLIKFKKKAQVVDSH
jgi:DHA2 family multidrug resistance protein